MRGPETCGTSALGAAVEVAQEAEEAQELEGVGASEERGGRGAFEGFKGVEKQNEETGMGIVDDGEDLGGLKEEARDIKGWEIMGGSFG